LLDRVGRCIPPDTAVQRDKFCEISLGQVARPLALAILAEVLFLFGFGISAYPYRALQKTPIEVIIRTLSQELAKRDFASDINILAMAIGGYIRRFR